MGTTSGGGGGTWNLTLSSKVQYNKRKVSQREGFGGTC